MAKGNYILFVTITLLFLAASTCLGSDSWLNWGGGLNNDHYNTDAGLSSQNVGSLQVKWTKPVGGDVSAIPTVYNGVAYFPDWAGNIWAVEVSTGRTVWQVRVEDFSGIYFSEVTTSTETNGSFSRASPALDPDNGRLYIGDTAIGQMYALNMYTGALIWKTLLDSHPYALITQSATVFDGRVLIGVSSSEEDASTDPSYVCCSFRGSFCSLDSATGTILWKTYMAPENYSGNAVWGSSPAVDPISRTVFIATGNNYAVPAPLQACISSGSLRCPQDPANVPDAIVSINIDTGAINWNYTILSSDVWNGGCYDSTSPNDCPPNPGPDADFGQAPMIFTTAAGITLIGAGEKNGYFVTVFMNGSLAWAAPLGGAGILGGFEWGSATDGKRIYVSNANADFTKHNLTDGDFTYGGYYAAIALEDGSLIWETAVPYAEGLGLNETIFENPKATAPVTVVNDVVFVGVVGIQEGLHNMMALDANTGKILWSFDSGASVSGAPTYADGVLLWGNGYNGANSLGIGNAVTSKTFYAFAPAVCLQPTPTPSTTTCSQPSSAPSPSCGCESGSSNDDDNDRVTINFYFADILRGL